MTEEIAFLLLERFSLMAFTSTIEPMRAANRAAGRELYRWRVLSIDGGPVRASNGLAMLADAPLGDRVPAPCLIVVASFEPEQHLLPATLARLRRFARFGVTFGALDTGAWLLAAAGLLDGYRITLHWEAVPAFAAAFPKVELSPHLFEIDRDRFTSAGGTSPMDMMLHLIARRHGPTIARAVTEQFVYGGARPGDLPQRPALAARLDVRDERLVRLVDAIDRDPADGWPLARLQRLSGLSARRLGELFRAQLGVGPARFVVQRRLLRARDLLEGTRLSIREIALESGFGSLEHFSRAYRARFGQPPSAARRSGRPATPDQEDRRP